MLQQGITPTTSVNLPFNIADTLQTELPAYQPCFLHTKWMPLSIYFAIFSLSNYRPLGSFDLYLRLNAVLSNFVFQFNYNCIYRLETISYMYVPIMPMKLIHRIYRSGKHCRPRSGFSWRSKLFRVCTVCHLSVYIYHLTIKPHLLKF